MLRLEFHCHTHFSEDSLLSPQALLAACRRKGIDRVVITDHNTIAGARQAYQLDPERVIIGEEIKTTAGELLAAFVQEEVPAGLSPNEAIARLRGQGAFISVSHPLDRYRGWDRETLTEIVPLIDALEIFNSRCIWGEDNQRAAAFARQHRLLTTVGSDAHTAWELGRAVMILPDFRSSTELRQATAQAQHQTRLSGSWIHLTSRWASLVKRISARNQTISHSAP